MLSVNRDTMTKLVSQLTTGSDSTKIEPLCSELKHGHHIDMSHRGVMGTDQTVDHSRIDPLGGRGEPQKSGHKQRTAD